jgi:hypothetical protein
MRSKVIRRTLKVRHSPVPRRRGSRKASKSSHSFLTMFAMLGGASDRLQRARRRATI